MGVHHLSLQSSLQQLYKSVSSQPRKHFGSNLAKDLGLGLSGQLLHERIEQLVTEFRVVEDDALCGSLDDLLSELVDVAKRASDVLVFGDGNWRLHWL